MCEECLVDTDCQGGKVCHASHCTTACQTDATCAPLGLVCDGKACVECTGDAMCPSVYYCNAGACVLDVCDAARQSCAGVGDTLIPGLPSTYRFGRAACNGRGDTYSTVTACSSNESCVATATGTACQAQACAPGIDSCLSSPVRALSCSPDGLTVLKSTTCNAGDPCIGGRCKPVICTPYETRCTPGGFGGLECSADGRDQTPWPCDPHPYCVDDPTNGATCVPEICEPGKVGCVNGNVEQCSANGSSATLVEDCGGKHELCGGSACAATVVVTSAGDQWAPTTSDGGIAGESFRIDVASVLTKLELEMIFTDARTLDLLVYEGTSPSGTYTKISDTTTNAPGSGVSTSLTRCWASP